MANLKVKDSPRTHAAIRTHDVIIDKNDNVGPYLMTIDEFLDEFGFNGVNYRVTEFVSGGAQNASSNFDVYVFRSAGTLQLPDSTTLNGQPIIIANLTTVDNITVTAFSGQSINGLSSIVISNQDSEQLIPTTSGFVLTAKNKIKSRSETLSWFNANPTVILDKGEQVFLLGSGNAQFKVGDSLTPLNLLPWSNKQLTDYITSNDTALANKQDKLNGGTGLVYSTAGAITYVTLNNGNMTSSIVTNGYVPYFDGASGTYKNGPVYRDIINQNLAVFQSPTSDVNLFLNDTKAILEAQSDISIKSFSGKISLASPDITNDRVVCIDASGNVVTIAITPALLANLSGSISPLQAQIITNDGNAVHLTGNETIGGIKTFSSSPIVPSPTTATQAANKAYVDLLAVGVQLKPDVDAVATGNVTLSGSQTVDTISSGSGKRILVPFQTNPAEVGVWITAAGAWTRSTDLDASIEFNNATVQCRAGSVNLNTQWTCTTSNPVVGTDPISFQKTSLSTTYNAGTGLTLASNTFSIANGAITNAMLAGSIDLTSKVTNVLAQVNGGKGNSTIYGEGSIPVQNNANALVEYAELKFDSVYKTLVLNNTSIAPTAGLSAIAIQSGSQSSPGINFNGAGNVIQAIYTGGDYAAVISGTNAAGKGIQVSTKDIAADFSSEREVLTINQTGEATANMIEPVFTVSRDTVLLNANGPLVGGVRQPFTSTGPLIYAIDNTASAGNRIVVMQQDITQMTLTKDSYLGLGNLGAPGFLIDDMIVMEGSADRVIKVAYHPTSGNAGKKLRLMGGSTAVGSTNLQGGNVEIVTGSSRGNLGANFVIYATPPGSSGSSENSATGQYIFKGDGRVGLGVLLPSARFELWVPNGANGIDIINKDQSSTNNTGWGGTPLTNGAGTNMVWYEKVSGVQTNRLVYHLGGNITIGNDSGSGDAKLNVKGTLKIEGGNPGLGKILYSNNVGLTSWDILPINTLAVPTYDVTSSGTPSKIIIATSIPAGTFANVNDKIIYDFVIGNTGGTSPNNAIYIVKLNGNAVAGVTMPLNTSSTPVSLKLILIRSGASSVYVIQQWNFGQHTTTLQNLYAAPDSNTYTFSGALPLEVYGDQASTNRPIAGLFGNGVYHKAS